VADAFLLENGVDRYLLEDSSGVYLSEQEALSVAPAALNLSLTAVAPSPQLRGVPGAVNLSLGIVVPTVVLVQSVSPPSFGFTLAPVAPQVKQRIEASLALSLAMPLGGYGRIGWGTLWGTGAMGITVATVAPGYALTLGFPPLPIGVTPATVKASLELRLLPLTSTTYWGSGWSEVWGATGPTMQVTVGTSVSALGLTLGIPTPQVNLGGAAGQTVTPAALPLSLGIQAPQVGLAVVPSSVGLTLTISTPSVSQVIGASFALTLSVIEPTKLGYVWIPTPRRTTVVTVRRTDVETPRVVLVGTERRG
jgi:hypothetical protein